MLYKNYKSWQETPEEGWRTHRSKCCEYNIKVREHSLKTLMIKII